MPSRLLALVLLAVTACGSSGSPQSSPSPSASVNAMTKEAYVQAANAICKDTNDKAEQVPEPENAEQFGTAITLLLDLMDEGQAALRALNPPAELRAEIETKFLAPNEEQAAALRAALPKIQEASQEKDVQAATLAFAEAFEDMGELAESSDAWAKDFGLTECTS